MRLAALTASVALALGACAAGPAKPAEPANRLEESPRHQEWVEVARDGRSVRCFVVYPEASGRRPAVIVIHENRGLTDWVRSVADRLGEEGFLAIAPDLLSGAGPGGGGTDAFATSDAARDALYALPEAQVTADLQAVADHAKSLPACNGTLAVSGFCWGGSQSFRFATAREDLAAAFVFYGGAPEDESALARIRCAVHGFYGGDDARINATLPATEERMRRLGKSFEPVVYPGAGHAFLRAGAEADAKEANRAACAAAWERWLGALRSLGHGRW